jgi:hypothetical protein
MARRNGIPAAAFMASFSSAGRLAPAQLQEQADIAARLTALGLRILTAEKSIEYRDASNAKRVAAIARMAAPRTCCNCETKAARWNSIYCSDACEREFLTFPEYNDEFSSKESN